MRTGFKFLVSAALMVGSLLATSCSTPASPAPAPVTATAVAGPYGSLTIAWSIESAGKLQDGGNIYFGLGSAIYEGLERLTPEGQVVPNIAEKLEIAADGLTQTYYIRKGIKFHDGSDLTAADVKFSIDRVIDPKSVVIGSEPAIWRRQIASVELKDSHTVVVRLKQPLFELLAGINPPTAVSSVVPKRYIDEKGEDYFARYPMGNGPWKVAKYEPGSRLELEAFEGHWRTVPHFKNIVILLDVKEEATKIAMLKTGELDIAVVSPDSVPGLKAAGLRVFPFDGGSQAVAYIYWDNQNPQKAPLGDVRVRKALSLGADRKEMADKLYLGYAEPSAVFYVRPTATFWDANQIKPDPYDPDGAKRLLAEAGYPSGFSGTILNTGGAVSTFIQALAGYWRRIGYTGDLVSLEYSVVKTYFSPKVTPEIHNKVFGMVTGGNIWQGEGLNLIYRSAATRSINNPKLDELIDGVAKTADTAQKNRLSFEATVLAKNEYSNPSFLELKTIFVVSSKVGELKPISGGSSYWGPVYASVTHAK